MSAVILIVERQRNFCASFRFPVCSLTILAAESLNVWKHCGKAAGILAVIIPTIS